MTEQNSETSDASIPINTYTFQEIISFFSEIDKKILSLHECSSDDFLTLNAFFKKHYSDSKIISSNATGLFALFTDNNNQSGLLERLQQFQDNIQELLSTYEFFINGQILATGQIIQEMDQMFVTANNLKQDLMTLKLLVTNLKLDISISSAPAGRIARKTNDFNELIIQTKSFFVEFYNRSNLLKESVKSLNQQLVQQRSRNIQHIHDIIGETNFSLNFLNQKYEEANRLIPKLAENTQNTSNSIAKIITNLQYQDIIRQKIDHIQQTHKDVLNELGQIKNTEELNTKDHVKHFIQIREIAGLQAAQLIHANKEYQKAIEIISGKFLEVGNDMTEISNLCQQLIGPNTSAGSMFEQVREKLEKTEYLIDNFQRSLSLINEKTRLYDTNLADIVSNYNELADFFATIDKSISRSLDNQNTEELEQFESTTYQIRAILKELKEINNLYNAQFGKITAIKLNTPSGENISLKTVEETLEKFGGQCRQLINNLYTNNESVYKIIADNQLLSKKISLDIKTSIEQIKYYDYFDKVIEEIIVKLNDINLKLINIDNSETKLSQLEYLKSRYTMESEHIIHDHLTKEDVDLFELNSTGADEDDDNLELF
ncbi:MAG: hypothetical protein Q8928_03615 [Bacteroidota bacterium]|nr:hypothetical protein [Bacteroidota bacterium]